MTNDTEATRSARRPLWLWIGIGVVAAIVAVLVIVAVVTGNAAPTASPSATPSASASEGSPAPGESETPDPSASAEPTPSATPTGDPDDPDAQPTPRPTRSPVDIDEPAKVEEGVAVRLTSIKPIEGTVTVPGDQAGPALLITVKAVNKTDEELSTPAVIVNVYYGKDKTPANILTRPRSDFPLVIEPGESATGEFAFTVPADERDRVVIEVDLSVGSPVVLFEGRVS